MPMNKESQECSVGKHFQPDQPQQDSHSIQKITIGSTVRATFNVSRNNIIASSRAIVSTIDNEENKATIIWETRYPEPISLCVDSKPASVSRFLITPQVSKNKNTNGIQDDLDEDDQIPLSSLSPLFSFEVSMEKNESLVDSQICKDRGDTLLRVKDYLAATEWYEKALSLTSKILIGSTVILNRGGKAVIADVDCIEGNQEKRAVDVTYMDQNEEKEEIISDCDVLLAIAEDDYSQRIQERTLLNLARCLLQIANMNPSEQQKFRKSAILACTLALSCSSYHDSQQNEKNIIIRTEEKARFLRAKVYMQSNKNKHAKADIIKLLKKNPNHKETLKLKLQLDRKQEVKKRSDKKLAKEMCKWVQTATNGESKDEKPQGDNLVSCKDKHEKDIKVTSLKNVHIKQVFKYVRLILITCLFYVLVCSILSYLQEA